MSRFNHVSFFRRWTVAVPTTSALGVSLLAALAGCSSGPSRVQAPSISASGAASEAMTAYDKDGDGFIAGAELDAAPSFKAAMSTLDLNKDSKVSEDEIRQRIEAWQVKPVGLTSIMCSVTLDGRPIDGATVTFEPEAFLGSSLKAAMGETSGGQLSPSIPKAERPDPTWPPGLQVGFYKVRVSKQSGGKESVPAKFNTETVLGAQVAMDDPSFLKQMYKFDLKSN
ncbi:hypothetical protein [Lacipirellula sp.]|uniref:hypothetical protein n=1 Tax=Lacipirellula sp. TaxID=2691419 RepID=UPI003D12320D